MKFLFDSDTWQEIYGSIRKNKVRTVITIIGVLWGIFLLVVLLGASRGMENSFKKIFGNFATNSVFVWTQSTDRPFKGFQKGRRFLPTLTDVKILKKEFKEIKLLAPRSQSNGQIVKGFKSGSFQISGDYPILDQVQKKNLIYGRFLNQNDILSKAKVTVIAEDIYKQLFEKGEKPIGEYIKINNINYKVIGVYKESSSVNFDGACAYIPFTTFQQVYNMGDKIHWMMITANEGVDIKQLEKDVLLTLKNLHKVHPDDKKAFGSVNLGVEIAKFTGFLTGMQFLTWFVGIATLIAGVFAIGNILLITVKERTKEIGIRRALGATPKSIRQQIVLESVFLTTIAGMLGIILGALVLYLIDMAFGQGPDAKLINPTVNIPIILIAFTTLVVLGTLIGLIPAHMATVIKPIEALREE
ncbi:ABC transporter permease [Tenacibaculum finnmarkense]|uniref:Multidrug ABC transporter ATP-binding protein n=1 Tax=Tenacibaculum finnmarkense genomovar ulcerans TaxID=2781388 RepID=A0A2I2LFP7_9FLAO|nr:ABC transporter permease [Tenacibaculum finnmarkense]ALU74629.1 multidrug ABC transporter ATP-binding protein [Tenacibaculum dicentrarchi]MBE7634008.1 FtsX-like permease family protein [Tenacibaculum finnmarkense genomovar ulcerans]MBE7645495.1 FtsX-like permease family protein [Tenacibaculum finnmarkense genomovar ulcerans]MBE7687545.1 FtsX-like permease family protein [Tenacibaculum finnmarkense genomovar ulcerans]MBE7697530.1 FtsX-like permease family protein [Tenacibaculum finnmarkense 